MDFEQLTGFEEGDVADMQCYVCGTRIDVVKQDVITNLDTMEAKVLPVCTRCSNAVGRVIELEDDVDQTWHALVDVSATLDVYMQENEQVRAYSKECDELMVMMLEHIADQMNQIEDLKARIEAGAGLNDVELIIIPSAAYEE